MGLRKFFFCLCIGFMGACTHKTDSYNFETIETVKVDESKLVLTTFPSKIEEIDTSTLAAINSYKNLSLYNIRTGENTANFNLSNVDFDSLMKCTFQSKYKGLRKYSYDTTNDGLSDEQGQIKAFQYQNGKFYIQVTTLANVEYINDSAALKILTNTDQIKALKAKYGRIKLQVTDYMNFLFETDRTFKIIKIFPLYESGTLRKQHYYPIYQKTFAVDGGYIYTFISRDDESYENMRAKKKAQQHYLAKVNLEDEEDLEYCIGTSEIDYTDFTINDFYGKPAELHYINHQLVYSNSRDICEVKTGNKIFSGKNLKSNETIDDFFQGENDCLIMSTFLTSPKLKPTEFETHYAVDSVHTRKIRVFDRSTQHWIAEGTLPENKKSPYSVGKSKIIYLDKDEQNYLFKIIPYNEN